LLSAAATVDAVMSTWSAWVLSTLDDVKRRIDKGRVMLRLLHHLGSRLGSNAHDLSTLPPQAIDLPRRSFEQASVIQFGSPLAEPSINQRRGTCARVPYILG
jgi:hypothetical protein